MRALFPMLLLCATAFGKVDIQVHMTTSPVVHRYAPILVNVELENGGDETARGYFYTSSFGLPGELDFRFGDGPWQPFLTQGRIEAEDHDLRFQDSNLEPGETKRFWLLVLWDYKQQIALTARPAGDAVGIRVGIRYFDAERHATKVVLASCQTTISDDNWDAPNPWPSTELMRYVQGEQGAFIDRLSEFEDELRRMATTESDTIPGRWVHYYLRRHGWSPMFPDDDRLSRSIALGRDYGQIDAFIRAERVAGIRLHLNKNVYDGRGSGPESITVRSLMKTYQLCHHKDRWLVWLPTNDGYSLEWVDPDEYCPPPAP